MIGLICNTDCPCEEPTCETTVNVCVFGCDLIDSPTPENPIPGATVTIKVGGVSVGTDTTDSEGCVSIVVESVVDAEATVEVTGVPTGYVATSDTITLDCGTVDISIDLDLDEGYSCSEDPCCPQGGDPPYLIPVYPGTLYLDVGIATVALTGGPNTWTGSATHAADIGYVLNDCSNVVEEADVCYTLTKNTGPSGCWTLKLTTPNNCAQQIEDRRFDLLYYTSRPGKNGTCSLLLEVPITSSAHGCDPVTADFDYDFITVAGVGPITTTLWPYFVFGETGTFTLSE